MMARLLIMIAGASLGLGVLTASVSAIEDRFIYVDRMPDVRGEHKRTLALDNEDNGQKIVQELFAEDFKHAVIETFVLSITCAPDAGPRTYIIAIKYPPKKPASFAVATLHDIYKEVYVEDRNGRIRLYEDVHGRSMLDLSERFLPACLPV
ncbi:MAG: hypothetical protein ACR2RF_13240 [Geminicoccaceae bacterium]